MADTKALEPNATVVSCKDKPLSVANSARQGAWPSFAEDEIEAAVQVLRSGKVNYWTGKEGRQFEKEFAAVVG